MPQSFGRADLLEYDEKYHVLICRECQYAIQKSAIPSHLLRHKIYRGERQQLLSELAQLELLEPEQVSLPSPTSESIENLAVISGHRCAAAGCGSLCASEKRMRRHWSEIHGQRQSSNDLSSLCRSVKLQTFFRGTKIRYFEVCAPLEEDSHDQEMHVSAHTGVQDTGNSTVGETASHLPVPWRNTQWEASVGTGNGYHSIDFDMVTLAHFHRFMTFTGLTLPSLDHSLRYWQDTVIQLALNRPWLMSGLFALTTLHVAILSDRQDTSILSDERVARYTATFSNGWNAITTLEPPSMREEAEDIARSAGAEIQCVLFCARLALAGFVTEPATPSLLGMINHCRTMAFNCKTSASQESQNTEENRFEIAARVWILSNENLSDPITWESSSDNNSGQRILKDIDNLPARMAEVLGKPKRIQDVHTTIRAIAMLKDCFSLSLGYEDIQVAWRSMVYWTLQLPEYFLSMIAANEPAALIVLAYWIVSLVRRAEHQGCWFLAGLPTTIVDEVSGRLFSIDAAFGGFLDGLMD